MSRLFPSWRDENATLHFPFTDYGPPTSGEWQMPTDLFVDANIHPPNSGGGYYLASMRVAEDLVFIEIGSETSAVAAQGVWANHLPDESVIPLFSGPDAVSAGVLVVSPEAIRELCTRMAGSELRFDPATSGFVVTTWGFTTYSPPERIFSGVDINLGDDLYLVGEDGVRLVADDSSGVPIIRVHAIGDPLSRLGDCGDGEPVPRFIQEVVFQQGSKTISCQPNELGEVFIVVTGENGHDTALRVYSAPGDLTVGFSS